MAKINRRKCTNRKRRKSLLKSRAPAQISGIEVTNRKAFGRKYKRIHHEFMNYIDIEKYLRKITEENSDKMIMEMIGNSSEGRYIYVIVLTNASSNKPKVSTLIEAGCNGFELYTVSSVLYIIDHIITNPSSLLIANYYIIPCVNPDGYEFALHKPYSRLKRMKKGIPQIDLSSAFPEIVKGLKRRKSNVIQIFKPEIFAMANVLNIFPEPITMYISLREYGRYILYPWGYTKVKCKDFEVLKGIACIGRDVSKYEIQIGSIAEVKGVETGTILDYLATYHSVQFVYAFHLCDFVPRNTKRKREGIIDIGSNAWNVINAMTKAISKCCDTEKFQNFELYEETVKYV